MACTRQTATRRGATPENDPCQMNQQRFAILVKQKRPFVKAFAATSRARSLPRFLLGLVSLNLNGDALRVVGFVALCYLVRFVSGRCNRVRAFRHARR